MNRQDVYAIIDGERDYQDAQSENVDRPDMKAALSPGEILLAMEEIMQEARRVWYKGSYPHVQMSQSIRKITALGVKFMEEHSAFPRKGRD